MAKVSFRDATRYYPGGARPAVDGLDLDVADGELLVLVGPSGCGKSTTLRMLAGLEGVDGGTVAIGDRDVSAVPAKERDIAMVFQNYALYPHMTAAENIGFHLKIRRLPKREIGARVGEAARLLGLAPYLDRRPAQLSGGQRQRVAMGRAIVRRPQVFLMDEPLSNLDAKLRVQTRTQIAALQRRLAVTTVYVTHDQVEAMTMGDRVAVLDEGVLQQCGTPSALYTRPVNVFVAGFIGSPAMNLLPAPVRAAGEAAGDGAGVGLVAGPGGDGAVVRIGGMEFALTRAQRAALTGGGVIAGVRPEDFEVTDPREGMAVTVDLVENLGADSYLYCSPPPGSGAAGHAPRAPDDPVRAGPGVPGFAEGGPGVGGLAPVPDDGGAGGRPYTVRTAGMAAYARGDRIGLRPRPGGLHLFDAATGRRLPD